MVTHGDENVVVARNPRRNNWRLMAPSFRRPGHLRAGDPLALADPPRDGGAFFVEVLYESVRVPDWIIAEAAQPLIPGFR